MNNGYMKLADMGLCKFLPRRDDRMSGRSLAFTMCGTPEFLAPEFIFSRGYDHRVDWWAYGCVVFEMLFGRNPFEMGDLKQTFNAITKVGSGEGKLDIDSHVERDNPPLTDFLRRLLCSQDVRLGCKNSDEISGHEFFGQMGFDWATFDRLEMLPPVKPTRSLQERYQERPGHPGQFFFDEVPEYTGSDDWNLEFGHE